MTTVSWEHKSNRKRLSVILFTAALLLVSMMSVLRGPTALAQDEVRIVIADGRGNWGPPSPYLHDRRGPGYVLMTFVFDTLLWKDETGTLIPALARSWQADDTGITFRLDPAATWHDGEPVTAADVVFTVDYARAHPSRFVDLSAVGSVRAVNPTEVRVDFARPFAPFLVNVAGTLPILPQHIFGGIDNPVRFAEPAAMTGSGPYRLKAYDPIQGGYLFEANADYYQGAPAVQEIAFVKMGTAAALAGLTSGAVDLMTKVPATERANLQAAGLTVLSYQMNHPVRLQFNHRHPVLADVQVRQAIAKLVDRPRLIETVYLGEADLWDAAGLDPLDATAPDPYAHDPAEAARMLHAAGWQRDSEGRWQTAAGDTLDLTMVALRHYDKLARMVAAQLEAAGIGVSVTLFDRGGLDAVFGRDAFDLAIVSFSTLGDPDVLRRTILGGRPDSDRYTANAALTRLLKDQASELDPVVRADMVARAGDLYAADLPSFFMLSPRRVIASNDRVQPFVTPGGIGPGIPLILNKQMFLP